MKRLSRTIGALLALALLLGCANIAVAEEEKVKLRYLMWDQSVYDLELETIVKPYMEENPNVEIELIVMPWDEYWTKVQVGISSGDPYDVFAMSVAYIWEFADKGLIYNLEDSYKQVVAEKGEDYLYESMLDVVRYPNASGDLYEMPYGWVGSMLFYNKDMFDAAGLDYPTNDWTYDDMWEAAEKLTTGAGPAKKYGIHINHSHEWLDAYINAAGGYVLNEDYTECLINQEPAVSAIQEVVDKLNSGIAPSSASLQGQPSPFVSGKVAMIISGSYAIEEYREITDFDWDCAMVPYNAKTGKRVIYGGPDGLAISVNTPYPEEAFKFMMYYCTEARGVESFMGGKASIVKAITEDEAWLESDKKPANKGVLLESAQYMKGADFCYKWSEWRSDIMNSELDAVWNGDATVQEACDRIAERTNAILAEIK